MEQLKEMKSKYRYRVVYVRGQGYGCLTPQDWDSIPDFARRRVRTIMECDTEAEAKAVYARLPQGWQDKPGLHYSNGEWWQSTEKTAVGPDGQEMELFVPADRPVPVLSKQAGGLTDQVVDQVVDVLEGRWRSVS